MAPKEENVLVVVRSRPMNEMEKKRGCKIMLATDKGRRSCMIIKEENGRTEEKEFTFDQIYPQQSTTEDIYHSNAEPIIQSVCKGYNGTIFAYGQTGSGKTYTMKGVSADDRQQGINPSAADDRQRGITPRAIDDIFKIMKGSNVEEYVIYVSCFEIYNEEIRDLLGRNISEKLDVSFHPQSGFYVKGLSKHPVSDVRQCENLMKRGLERCVIAATKMNSESSRSHTILSICIETQGSKGGHIRSGKLNLVDLAGSERSSKTGATGIQLKEGIKINLSLHTLGKVIWALAEGKATHIPYRDSKLTRILQDSLGGNAKTVMIACISPADYNYEETLSTLRFAHSAKNIKNKPVINEDPRDALLRQYQEQIRALRAQLETGPHAKIPGADLQALLTKMERKKEEEYELEKVKLKQEYEDKLAEMARRVEEADRKLHDSKPVQKSVSVEEDDSPCTELRLVLVGKTGAGKSATGNSLLGLKQFESKACGISVTQESQCGTALVHTRPVLVIDTPGIFDTLQTNDERKTEIMRCVALSSPGIHAILFVTQVGPFTAEEQKTLEFYKESFGPRIMDYVIVVFTRKDNLEFDGITLDQFIQRSAPTLQQLLKACNNRYLTVNNRAETETSAFRRRLFKMVDDTLAQNSGVCYTNSMFEAAEEIMRREEEIILTEMDDEDNFEWDAVENAEAELKIRQKEEFERQMEEQKQREEAERQAIKAEMDEMETQLKQMEERRAQKLMEEHQKALKSLQEEADDQTTRAEELKAQLEAATLEQRQRYEEQLQASLTQVEELQRRRQMDLELARAEQERQKEVEKQRIERLKREKEEEMKQLQEKAEAEKKRLQEEEDEFLMVLHQIYEDDYTDYVTRKRRKARERTRREIQKNPSLLARMAQTIKNSVNFVLNKF